MQIGFFDFPSLCQQESLSLNDLRQTNRNDEEYIVFDAKIILDSGVSCRFEQDKKWKDLVIIHPIRECWNSTIHLCFHMSKQEVTKKSQPPLHKH